MARRTVRVEIPRSEPDNLIKLGEAIVEGDTRLGADSALNGKHYLASLADRVSRAKAKRKEANDLEKQVITLRAEADHLLGIGEGQNQDTPDTALFYITSANKDLRSAHRTIEEKMGEYGFSVRIGTAADGGRRKADPATPKT